MCKKKWCCIKQYNLKIVQHKNSAKPNSAILKQQHNMNIVQLNNLTSNIATLKVTTLKRDASLFQKDTLWQLNIIAIVIICRLTTALQSAKNVAQQT